MEFCSNACLQKSKIGGTKKIKLVAPKKRKDKRKFGWVNQKMQNTTYCEMEEGRLCEIALETEDTPVFAASELCRYCGNQPPAGSWTMWYYLGTLEVTDDRQICQRCLAWVDARQNLVKNNLASDKRSILRPECDLCNSSAPWTFGCSDLLTPTTRNSCSRRRFRWDRSGQVLCDLCLAKLRHPKRVLRTTGRYLADA
jgi:hypothetical protein